MGVSKLNKFVVSKNCDMSQLVKCIKLNHNKIPGCTAVDPGFLLKVKGIMLSYCSAVRISLRPARFDF